MENYISLPPLSIPKDAQGLVEMDVFVFLPTQQKHICYVKKGGELSAEKIKTLQEKAVDKNLYVRKVDYNIPMDVPSLEKSAELILLNIASEGNEEKFFEQTLGKQFKAEQKKLYKDIMGLDNPSDTLIAISNFSEKTVDNLVPEIKDLRTLILKNIKYLKFMEDSSAISSIAITFAVALNFHTKKSFKELTIAALLMDLSLAEFTDEEMFYYYTDKSKLSPEMQKKALSHPADSYSTLVKKMSKISHSTLELILNHHELFSGKGYPRGIRNDTLFPMAKILSLAVDVFESLKRASLEKQNLSFEEAVLSLRDNVEPHMRRHSIRYIEDIIAFLDINPNKKSFTVI